MNWSTFMRKVVDRFRICGELVLPRIHAMCGIWITLGRQAAANRRNICFVGKDCIASILICTCFVFFGHTALIMDCLWEMCMRWLCILYRCWWVNWNRMTELCECDRWWTFCTCSPVAIYLRAPGECPKSWSSRFISGGRQLHRKGCRWNGCCVVNALIHTTENRVRQLPVHLKLYGEHVTAAAAVALALGWAKRPPVLCVAFGTDDDRTSFSPTDHSRRYVRTLPPSFLFILRFYEHNRAFFARHLNVGNL